MTKVKRWSDSSDLICTMYSQFHQPTCCSNLSRQCVDTDFSKWNLFATHILLIPSTQSYFLSYVTFPRFLTHPFKSLPLNNMWNYFTVALPTISIGLREERPIISTYGCNITQFDQNQILVSTFRIHSCLLNVSIVELWNFTGKPIFFTVFPLSDFGFLYRLLAHPHLHHEHVNLQWHSHHLQKHPQWLHPHSWQSEPPSCPSSSLYSDKPSNLFKVRQKNQLQQPPNPQIAIDIDTFILEDGKI